LEQCNCSVLACPDTTEARLVDPGGAPLVVPIETAGFRNLLGGNDRSFLAPSPL